MGDIGRLLVFVGVIVAALGLILMFADKISFLGRLPGDFVIRRRNTTIYFPLVTMLIVSVVLTIILNLFTRK
jgi:hypothetical protein